MKNKNLFNNFSNIKLFALRGNQDHQSPLIEKTLRIIKYYYRLINYAITTDSKIFHIQWLNKFIFFDRTFLMLFYKMLGKKIIFTAHDIDSKLMNANSATSLSSKSNVFTYLSQLVMYKFVDCVVAHTSKIAEELKNRYHVSERKIFIIPHGINNYIKSNSITKKIARDKLGLPQDSKILLFFGNISPYKGVDIFADALIKLKQIDQSIFGIIAGKPKNCDNYMQTVRDKLKNESNVIIKDKFIPDNEVEILFKASDCLCMPYRYIYQSGILFLAYSMGIPIIASSAGSFKEEVQNNPSLGIVYEPNNPEKLANAICSFFDSSFYKDSDMISKKIIKYGKEHYSWEIIANKTFQMYLRIELNNG